jgi:hypothetical protein
MIELLTFFAAGVVVAVVVGGFIIVAVGIRREEASRTLTITRASDRLARGTRVVHGVYARAPAGYLESSHNVRGKSSDPVDRDGDFTET